MKLKKEFVTHTTDKEQLMIAVNGSFNGMVRSNGTAAAIIDLLKNEITREEIILSMLDTYDVQRDVLEPDVDRILAALRGIGAIDE